MARMDNRGRVVLPQNVRDDLGLTEGSRVNFEKRDGVYVVLNGGNIHEELIALFGAVPHSMADRLTAGRQVP